MRTIRTFMYGIYASIFVALPVYAQGNLLNAGKNLDAAAKKAGTTEGDVSSIVGIVINAMLTLVGLFFLILMVYAGYLWMTARGEADQVEKAKKIIVGALIGLVIVLSAYAITVFVTGGFVN
jgi:hypothetical protein